MEDEVDKERQSKWKIKGEDVDEEECAECVALKEKVSDLKFELEAEHRDAEKTIRDVEKMEDQHKQEIEKLYRELDFEKDKVVALTSTLDHERKARMQEIYKIERQSLEHDHNMKDYNFINEKNQNLGQEFEAVKRENETLINITKQLQDNKISILEQMKIYETQITELERKNTDLRKRLYDSDNEKDRHKVQAARMKQKLHDYLNGIGDRTMPKKETKTSSLGPLKSFSKVSVIFVPYFSIIQIFNIIFQSLLYFRNLCKAASSAERMRAVHTLLG
jgi:chromosome segregation ATPase